jgi:hypothetical protein
MENEYMYNINNQEAELKPAPDGKCTVSIDGKEIHTFENSDKAYNWLQRKGFRF